MAELAPSPHDPVAQGARSNGSHALVTAACVVIVVAALKAGASFLIPVAVALFLSVLSYPIMKWLMRRKVPHVVSLLLTLLVIFSTIGLLLYGGVSLLKSFWRDVPAYALKMKTQVDNVGAWLEDQGVEGAKASIGQFYDVQGIVDFATKHDVMNTVASFAGATFGTVASLLTSFVVVLVLMLVVLREAPGTDHRAALVLRAGGPDLRLLAQSVADIQKYLGVKTLISAATGVLAALWCVVFGLKYPLLWGILAFVFNFIPAIGSTAAGLPAMIEALVVHGVGSAVGIGIGYAAINFCLDSLVQPMLVGKRFGIPGLVVVVSVVFWGWLWGAIGMFLAVPLTMMLKVLLENTEEFRWVSAAMTETKVTRGAGVPERQLAESRFPGRSGNSNELKPEAG